MIELKYDALHFSFPEVHPDASLSIDFQRTLRIPDDEKVYCLPPGLGQFPLRHVDDFAANIPAAWREHGGVMLPMFQSEAMWLHFSSPERYPFLVKIATGKINAVTGEPWREGAHRHPQDYLVVPDQPWLDGFCVKKGEIRQFVAMPLGQGYTTEEQLTGKAEHGGLQIAVYPLKAAEWKRRQKEEVVHRRSNTMFLECCVGNFSPEMGLAPGGRMKQTIHEDPNAMENWDLRHGSRCFTHIANSLNWRAITGQAPPTIPPTARQYSEAGLPWFDHYSEAPAVEGAPRFKRLRSVKTLGEEKGESPLPENEPAQPQKVVVIKARGKDEVREGTF